MTHLISYLGPTDANRFAQAVGTALERAYTILSARHDADAGDDGHTFGVGAWRLGSKQVADALALSMPEAEVSWPNGSLEIRLGGKVFHLYRAGEEGESASVFRLDGTDTKVSIRQSNAEQLSLGFLDHADEGELEHLVLLHCGDPESGLDSIQVGAPTSLSGVDTTWLWMEQVWPVSSAAAGGPDASEVRPFGEGPRPNLDLALRDDDADQRVDGA